MIIQLALLSFASFPPPFLCHLEIHLLIFIYITHLAQHPQADIFMMQNWEHILVLMEALNKQPRNIQELDTDLTRIRLWSLDGHAPLYRQTLLFSATPIDHNRALISKCMNFTGRLQVLCDQAWYCVLCTVSSKYLNKY